MFSGKISQKILPAALLALACGPIAVHAQSAKSPAGSASEGSTGKSSSTQDASTSGSGAAKGTLSSADQKFLRDMAHANIAEIEAGKLAQSKSQNDEVKTFAQKMIDDHTKALQELQTVAQAKGVTLPTRPDVKHLAATKMLSALSGDQFDRRYMQRGGLADHQETHRLLQRAGSSATDPDVKQLAARTLPIVDQHLSMAQQLQASIKTSGSPASGSSGTGGTTGSGAGSSVNSATGSPGGTPSSGASSSSGSSGSSK
jgi:putative membrane protein